MTCLVRHLLSSFPSVLEHECLEIIITDPDIAAKRVVNLKPDQCPFKSLGVDCKNNFYVLRGGFSGIPSLSQEGVAVHY